MFRCQNHVGCPKKGIWACGEHRKIIIRGKRERNLRTSRATNPLPLRFLYVLRPVNALKIVYKSVCIISDFKHPLWHFFLLDNITRTFTFITVDDLFVSNDCVASRTPIDDTFTSVRYAIFKKFSKHPLCPAIVGRISCASRFVPGKGAPHTSELVLHICNVFIGPLFWVKTTFYCGILGRKTKRVKTHWI